MNHSFNRETVPNTHNIRFWTKGKITESDYRQISTHQRLHNDLDAQAMLEEWIIKPQ